MNLFVIFVFLWIFFLGAAFGSFMNVVVWRLPQKMSLSRPASHCPRCGHSIRWRHNIPVFGWLTLRGKCFDCRTAISVRYPVVEFISGCGFLLIALKAPYDWIADFPFLAWEWGGFLTCLGAGLILWDKNRVPLKLFWPFMLLYAWFFCHAAKGVSLASSFHHCLSFQNAEMSGNSFLLPIIGSVWLFLIPFARENWRRPIGILTLAMTGSWIMWGTLVSFFPIPITW